MLPLDRVEQIFLLHRDGLSSTQIARQLGHSAFTVRAYLRGQRTPGRSQAFSRPDPFTDTFADYCRQRLAEDPHLPPSALLRELAELGFRGSRATFYRKLTRHQLLPPNRQRSQAQDQTPQATAETFRFPACIPRHAPALPRSVSPITGETLVSYLTRLAHANHLSLTEVLAILPAWFSTKTSNSDDRAQHHMLIPAAAEALEALARVASAAPASLTRALPAFAADIGAHSPVRATTACRRCTARRGILQPVPVHLPAHYKVCTRHGIWLSDAGQPHLDLAACPEITTAQHRANRLLRRHTSQQLTLTYQAATKSIPPWPMSPAAIPHHWRHRLLTLQTVNHRCGTPTDHDAYMYAAIYPDAIALAAAELNARPAGPD